MSAVIFNGSKVKSLKPILSLNGGAELHSGTVDVQAVATSAPAGSTYHRTDTGDVYRKLDSGSSTNWVLIGSGGGGGGINFVGLDTAMKLTSQSDVDAEVTVGNHVAYADAAGVSPVDMTGGSPGTTVTRSASSPLNGAGSIVMDLGSGSSRQGEGHSLVVNIPPGYRGLRTEYSFAFAVTGALVEDDLRLSVYDVTNAALITDVVHVNKVLGAKGIARLQFSTATTTAQIRVGLHVARTTTAALSVKMDDFQVGPKLSTVGLAGSDTYSQELTFEALGTVSSNSAKLWRVGDRLHVKGSCTLGTTTGSDAYIILPGLSIDSAKVGPQTREILGTWYRNTAAGNSLPSTQAGPFALRHITSEPTKVSFSIAVNTAASDFVFDGVAGTSVGSSGDEIVFEFSAPIAGWSSNVSIGSSTTFNISSYLATGTRVTGSAPTKLGEYRSYLRDASGVSLSDYTEVNGDPSVAPSATDGIRIWAGNAFASADTNNNPSRYDIFVGYNKTVRPVFYANAGRSGTIDADAFMYSSTESSGFLRSYDPTTGIFTIFGGPFSAGTSSRFAGVIGPAQSQNDLNFDLVVSENALSVGVELPRSSITVDSGNGHGSSGTSIRRFTNIISSVGGDIVYADSASDGASFTVASAGVYSVTYSDTRAAGTSDIGISVNAPVLSGSITGIPAVNRKALASSPDAGSSGLVSATLLLNAGDIVRAHTDGTPDSTGIRCALTITKVSS